MLGHYSVSQMSFSMDIHKEENSTPDFKLKPELKLEIQSDMDKPDDMDTNYQEKDDLYKEDGTQSIESKIVHNKEEKMFDQSHCNDMMEHHVNPLNVAIDAVNGLDSQEAESNIDEIVTNDDLRQFDVLDDLERHPDQNCSDMDSDTNESMDSDVPDEEIEAMLEEGNY